MSSHNSLTRYPEGSIRELWTLSVPLMLSILSTNIMLFLDRLILARYSLDSMNGAAIASIAYAVLHVGIVGVVAIVEVFVGRFNGSGKQHKIGNAVWQMIWFSIATTALYWSIGAFAAESLAGGHEFSSSSVPYFKWLTFFGPAAPIVVAISAFFIGTGRTKIVMIATILGNLINVILDLILVFGVEGWIPSMGTVGAAIATGMAQLMQVLIMGTAFLSKSNKLTYTTQDTTWNPSLLKECLRIGLPSSLGHMIEVTAWALIIRMMAMTSELHVTTMAVGQGVYTLVAFVMEGLNKAVTAIAANLFGANKTSLIKKLRRSALILLFILSGVAAIPLLLFPNMLIEQFLVDVPKGAERDTMIQVGIIAAYWIWAYFIVDGITWINAGLLTAKKDTTFIAVANGLSAWFVALVPTYLIVVKGGGSPTVAWIIVVFYGTVNAIAFTLRANRIGKT